MKSYLILSLVVLAAFMFSCKEDPQPQPDEELKEFDIAGTAQKGPFINGSSVTIYDLDTDFKPTGRSFLVNTDAKGHFELTNVELSSNYVQIMADGFYYNEVSGDLSDERIMLKALVRLSEENVININILTNLEYERIKYLMANQATSYQAAKVQAQKELLKIFNMDEIEIEDAELLDIAKTGEGDAVLLAVSAILQGNRTTAELSKLQADMIADMKQDGELNDTLIQSALISHSKILNIDQIGKNVVSKFNELGLVIDHVNDFSQYVENFNLHSTFHYRLPYEFPASVDNRTNLLDMNVINIISGAEYSFAVKMAAIGKVKIRLKLVEGNNPWLYQPFVNHGWQVSQYDFSKNEQTFTSTVNNDIANLPIDFPAYGTALVEYYFNDSATPSFSKTINWGVSAANIYEFRSSPLGIVNLLGIPMDDMTINNDYNYVMGVYSEKEYDLKFKLRYPSNMTCEVVGGNGNYSKLVTTNALEIFLKSNASTDSTQVGGLSEVALKFTGTGVVTIESNMIQNDGSYYSKTITFE